MDYRILITEDTLDIAQRIREIDGDYRIAFNRTKGRLEVHNIRQRGNTLALVLPYDTLDCRALGLTRKTRIDNIMKSVEKLEEHNEKTMRGFIEKRDPAEN